MPGISPEEMQAMQAEAQAPEGGGQDMGAITKIAQDVGGGLAKLAEALDSSQAATDQDRALMADVIGKFTTLVEKHLGAGPGEDPEAEAEPMPPEAPAMGGLKGVPMGPQSRR